MFTEAGLSNICQAGHVLLCARCFHLAVRLLGPRSGSLSLEVNGDARLPPLEVSGVPRRFAPVSGGLAAAVDLAVGTFFR